MSPSFVPSSPKFVAVSRTCERAARVARVRFVESGVGGRGAVRGRVRWGSLQAKRRAAQRSINHMAWIVSELNRFGRDLWGALFRVPHSASHAETSRGAPLPSVARARVGMRSTRRRAPSCIAPVGQRVGARAHQRARRDNATKTGRIRCAAGRTRPCLPRSPSTARLSAHTSRWMREPFRPFAAARRGTGTTCTAVCADRPPSRNG